MGQSREPWKHSDSQLLGDLRLMLAICGQPRKEWYEAFEHTPDEITMARIELKHAEYFARMTALKWVRYWTRPNRMARSFAPEEPGWYGFPDRSP